MCCTPTERLLIVLTLPVAVVVLSIGYRPLGSCPRTAGWSAATLCFGPTLTWPSHRQMSAVAMNSGLHCAEGANGEGSTSRRHTSRLRPIRRLVEIGLKAKKA